MTTGVARVLGAALLAAAPVLAQRTAAVDAGGCSALSAVAWSGQTAPGGGSLQFDAVSTSARLSGDGRVVFLANVSGGSPERQLLRAGPGSLRMLVGSCAPGAGCGTPTPLGGTFTDLAGTTSAGGGVAVVDSPAVNAAGDVLFFAQLEGGLAPRGLFLYRDATDDIVAVAAVGQPGPEGSTYAEVGAGSLGDSGVAVFLARLQGETTTRIVLWDSGVASSVAAAGDAAPGGGSFGDLALGTVSYAGSTLPARPRPAVNAFGQVAFLARIGTQDRIVRTTAGVHELLVKLGDPVPGGGTYEQLWEPQLNGWGEVAFYAKYGNPAAHWGHIVGEPGAWRRAVATTDVLPGGATVFALHETVNPLTALDDAGNLAFWVSALPIAKDRIYVSRADNALQLVVLEGQPAPTGGMFSKLGELPCLRDGRISVDARTPGGLGGSSSSAHHVLAGALVWQDVGHALAGAAGRPRLRGEGPLSAASPGALRLTHAPAAAAGLLFVGFSQAPLPFKGGALVPALGGPQLPIATTAQGTLELAWTSWPAGVPACTELAFQAWIADATAPKGAAASNALVGRTP